MKKILLSLFLCSLISNLASAQQLDGTDWATKWGLPINDSIFYKFRNDTLYVTDKKKTNIFTSTYTEDKDTLRMADVSGTYACARTDTGVYNFEINGNTLTITIYNDPCQVREGVIPSRPLKKRTVANVSPLSLSSSLQLYPNPAQDWLSLGLNANEQVTKLDLYNAQGIRVNNRLTTMDLPNKLHVHQLEPGVYFVHIITQKGLRTARFIKK